MSGGAGETRDSTPGCMREHRWMQNGIQRLGAQMLVDMRFFG